MAIVQTGSTLQLTIGTNANTGTVSTTITVPADAELIVVGVADYCNSFNSFYSTGSMTFTKGGVDTAMTSVATGGDTINNFSVAMFYMALPDTGSNKTLKWDWLGTGISTQDFGICSITFWKGVNTASPMRSGSAGIGTATPALHDGDADRADRRFDRCFCWRLYGRQHCYERRDMVEPDAAVGSDQSGDDYRQQHLRRWCVGNWLAERQYHGCDVDRDQLGRWRHYRHGHQAGGGSSSSRPAADADQAMAEAVALQPYYADAGNTGAAILRLTADPGAVTLAGVAATLTYAPHVGAIVQTGSNVDFPFYNSSTSGTITTT